VAKKINMRNMSYQCYNLGKLKSVEFNYENFRLEQHVFSGCESLEEIILPKGITWSNELRPQGYFDRCYSLKTILLSNPDPPYIAHGDARHPFTGLNPSEISLIVPNDLYLTYKNHQEWGKLNVAALADSFAVSAPAGLSSALIGEKYPFEVSYFSKYEMKEYPHYSLSACIHITPYNFGITRSVRPWKFFDCITLGEECMPKLKELTLSYHSTQIKVYSDTTIHVNNSVDRLYIEAATKAHTDIVPGSDGYKLLNVGENSFEIRYFSLCADDREESIRVTIIRDEPDKPIPTNIDSPDVIDEVVGVYSTLGKRIHNDNKTNEKIKIIKYKSGKIKKELIK
jgi:hypothetical protein